MNKLRIFPKIFLSHTIIGLFSVLILSFIFYTILKNALIQRTVDQLSSINILKEKHIKNYFSRLQKDILFLLNRKEALNYYQGLPGGGKTAQREMLDYFKEELPDIQKLYDFENITLVDTAYKTIYSTTRDTSYLRLIPEKKYIDTSAAYSEFRFKIVDASASDPPGKTLLLYIIPLIIQNEKTAGFVIIKEKFQKIQNILYERTGMGSTGESYIVGVDYFMRSPSRFFPEKPPLSIRVRTEAIRNAISQITDNNLIRDYRGEEVLSISRPIERPELGWILVSEMDYSEALKPIKELKTYFVGTSLVIIALILFITYFISNAISNPILYLKDMIMDLSKGIIPAKAVQLRSEDEIGEITEATGLLIQGLRRTTEFANQIGLGNFNASFTTLSDKDSLGMALLDMRDQLKRLNEREVRLVREKAAALVEGQENERKRIIRELHDGVGQLLTVVKLRVEMMEGQKELKEDLRLLVNDTITEVRRISYNVMPSAIVDFGLEAALKGLCENMKKYSGLPIDFRYVKEYKGELNFEASITVFRIAQEGLNNIIKHAKASHATVYVVEDEGQIYLMIKDNGAGFDPVKVRDKGGFGLTGMKERARLINGDLEIHSQPGSGTILEVHIPVKRD